MSDPHARLGEARPSGHGIGRSLSHFTLEYDTVIRPASTDAVTPTRPPLYLPLSFAVAAPNTLHGRRVSGAAAHLRELAEQLQSDEFVAGADVRRSQHTPPTLPPSRLHLYMNSAGSSQDYEDAACSIPSYYIKYLTYIAGDLMIAPIDGPLSSPGSNPAAAEDVRRPCCPC
jgi:hypothetical protein